MSCVVNVDVRANCTMTKRVLGIVIRHNASCTDAPMALPSKIFRAGGIDGAMMFIGAKVRLSLMRKVARNAAIALYAAYSVLCLSAITKVAR